MDTADAGASVSERPDITEELIVLPVYLVVDVSASLTGDLDSINEAVASLFNSLKANPRVVDVVRVSLIGFSDNAQTILPLGDVREVISPGLVAGGTTNYSAALSLVRQVIPDDVAALKREGFRVNRPLMFFVTDGSPVDPSWRAALDDLRSPEFLQRPTIVAIGFGSVDPAIIREIGKGKGGAFMISDAIGIPDAIDSMWSGMTSMLTATVMSTSSGLAVAWPVQIPQEWLNLESTA
jgi:uncharacterized protein YegL